MRTDIKTISLKNQAEKAYLKLFVEKVESLPRKKSKKAHDDEFALMTILDLLIGLTIRFKGVVYSSQEWMAEKTGFSKRQIIRVLNILKSRGLLTVYSRSNKKAKIYITNVYKIHKRFFDAFVVRSLYPLLRSLRSLMKNVTQYYMDDILLVLEATTSSVSVSTLETPSARVCDPPPESTNIIEKIVPTTTGGTSEPFVPKSQTLKRVIAYQTILASREEQARHIARNWYMKRGLAIPPHLQETLKE